MQSAADKTRAWIGGVAGAFAAYVLLVRPRLVGWGATSEERTAALPGDEFLPSADIQATRAITIGARAEEVWPWIAQMGQGRSGLYSYDRLENLLGCEMHSADRIIDHWQVVTPGDAFKLHPEYALHVASVDSGRALVVRGGIPLSEGSPPPFDFSWGFVLRPQPDGATRLIVRERYRHKRRWARLVTEPTQAVSFFMTEKMLRGIRDRAEARLSS